MATATLISAYNSLKSSFNKEITEYNDLISVHIPSAVSQIKSAHSVLGAKQHALRLAVTAESVKTAKADVIAAEEHLSDLTQLKENLERQSRSFEHTQDTKERELRRARIDMWQSIRHDLISSLNLSPEVLSQLERVVVATGNAEFVQFEIDGSLGTPIKEKYGSIDSDRMQEITEVMMAEMGIA